MRHVVQQALVITSLIAYRQGCARSGWSWRLRLGCGAIREDGFQALHHLRLRSLRISLQRRSKWFNILLLKRLLWRR